MRPSRDRWLWAGGLFLTLSAFLAAVAIAYFTTTPHHSLWNGWMLTAGVSYTLSFTCFFAATTNWAIPLPQARRFPPITLNIYAAGSTQTERESGSGLDVTAHLRSLTVQITNTSTHQPASLTIRLYITLTPGSWGQASEFLAPPPTWTLPPALNLHPLPTPIHLPPGDTTSGQLIFELPSYHLNQIATPLTARLEITDHTSTTTVTLPAKTGTYNPDNMTKTTPGPKTPPPQPQPPPTTTQTRQPQA